MDDQEMQLKVKRGTYLIVIIISCCNRVASLSPVYLLTTTPTLRFANVSSQLTNLPMQLWWTLHVLQ